MIFQPICETDAEFEALYNLTTTLFNAGGTRGSRLTGCLPNCHQHHYTVKRVEMFDSVKPGNDDLAIVGWYFKTADLKVTEEVLRYSFGDIVADVGGDMGLLLGASILSVYDYALEITGGILTRKKNQMSPVFLC